MNGGQRALGSAVWLALLGSCTGPVLDVGQLRVAELDGGSARDARVPDGSRRRGDAQQDAQQDDDDDHDDDRCIEHRDCADGVHWRRCYFGRCVYVECVDDRDCSCIESEGVCKDDRPRPP